MSENKHLIKTIGISGFAVFLSYLINLVLTSYVTETIGIEAYGFVAIAKSFVGYAAIITTALTTFVVRYISVTYHQGKTRESQIYFSSSVGASVILGGILILCATGLVFNLHRLLIIPEPIMGSVRLLFIVMFLNLVIMTVTTPYSSAVYIRNRLDLSGVIRIGSYIIEAAVLVILFWIWKPSVWFVGMGLLVASSFTLICNMRLTKQLTPELQLKAKEVSFVYVKELVCKGVWNSLNSLGNVLNSGLDVFIANRLLTGVQTGQISVVKTIDMIFSNLYQVVFQPFQPKLIEAYSSGDKAYFIKETQKAMSVCGYFSNIAFAGFFALGKVYFQLWLPGEDSDYLYLITLISILGSITAGVSQPVYYVNTLTVKNKIPCWITIFSGIVNVISMIFLLNYTDLGPIAIVGTTSIIMLCINLFFNPIYSAKCIGVSPIHFYRIIARHIGSVVVMVLIFYLISKLYIPSSWLGLIGMAVVMAGIGLVIHASVMLGIRMFITKIESLIRRAMR